MRLLHTLIMIGRQLSKCLIILKMKQRYLVSRDLNELITGGVSNVASFETRVSWNIIRRNYIRCKKMLVGTLYCSFYQRIYIAIIHT